jgi:SAM-dependent methyltransferase
MNVLPYLFGVVLVLLIMYFVAEWNSITYGIREMFTTELAGLPTSNTNLNSIRNIMEEEGIDTRDMKLIDFGCGKGDVLKEFESDYRQLIGIEINPKLAKIARNMHRDTDKIRIHNTDIQEYNFKNTSTVLYAYEPLWQVEKSRAVKIYQKVIDNLEQISSHPVYVVYLTGLFRSDMAPILTDSEFDLVRHARLGIYPYRDLYVYRLEP